MTATPARHRVVIVGGGFGGLAAARGLRSAPVEVLLLDARNFHLFQPLLYQVATGGLSPANIATPLRAMLAKQRNARVRLARVADFDLERREVLLGDHGERVPYDSLIVAAGARYDYFGHDGWAPFAPSLKTLEDALEIRRRVLAAFELAEQEPDSVRRHELLTFVVVGGGPTGVELAGALAEIARDTVRDEFRAIEPGDVSILLVEGSGTILPGFTDASRRRALRALTGLGVEVRLHARVTDIDATGVEVHKGGDGDGDGTRVATRTVLWAAGVRATSLAARLGERAGVEVDRGGRLAPASDLTLANHPDLFVIGDTALVAGEDGRPLPGVAPVAMQQGEYVAKLIADRLSGRGALPPFRYRDQGTMATIGRAQAVVELGPLRLWGLPGWVTWLGVHLLQLASFQNRTLVLTQWAWHYFTRNRGARLITGRAPAASGDDVTSPLERPGGD